MNKTIDYLGVHRHSLLIALNSPQPTLATNKEQQQLASTQYNTIQHNTTQHNTTQHNTTHNTMTAPTDAQWAAMSKLLQSMIQRSDTGTYAMHHNIIVCVVRSETNTDTKRNETKVREAVPATQWFGRRMYHRQPRLSIVVSGFSSSSWDRNSRSRRSICRLFCRWLAHHC
jgi:hypothetical protein